MRKTPVLSEQALKFDSPGELAVFCNVLYSIYETHGIRFRGVVLGCRICLTYAVKYCTYLLFIANKLIWTPGPQGPPFTQQIRGAYLELENCRRGYS